MFTGIIKEKGELKRIGRKGDSLELDVLGPHTAAEAEPGDSVAVNGVCLTVTRTDGRVMCVDVGEETYRRTAISGLKVSDTVNLEPALRVGDKMGGHIVSGHVDGIGRIASVTRRTTEIEIKIAFPQELAAYIAPKGSIAVDGISLTVGETSGPAFSLHIIPHTLENTTLETVSPGDRVNLEVDVLARYVVNAMNNGRTHEGGLVDKMVEFGYMKAADNA